MSVLSDSVCVITGASSGIGHATAVELARHNVKVVVCARRAERLEAMVKEIIDAGGHALACPCDVTDRSQVDSAIDQTIATFGRIDSIINNAGVMPISRIEELHVDDWMRMIDVNIKGVLYGVAAALPHMLKQGHGHIINVSSVAGRRIFPGGTVYCATKHAVHAISDGLRAELASKNIRVTIIAPGIVRTELAEHVRDIETKGRIETMLREGEPLESVDIARAILYSMEAPSHVGISEILVRPTTQEP